MMHPRADDGIEALRRRVAELEAEQLSFRTIFYSIGDAVITTDLEGRVSFMNQAAESLTGWTEAEARGRQSSEVFRIVNEGTGDLMDNPVSKVIRDGKVIGLANHTILLSRDGTSRPIADSGAPVLDDQGAITGVVLVFRDQSAERAAEKALAASESLNRTMVESIPLKLFLKDRSSRYITVNGAYASDFGLEPRDFSGKDDFDFYSAELAGKYRADDEAVMISGAVKDVEESYVAGGKKYWVHTIKAPVVSKEGAAAGLLGLFWDVTEKKNFEERLKEQNAELRRMRFIFDSSIAANSAADANGAMTEVNQAFADMWGYPTREECLGKTVVDFFHDPAQAGPVMESLMSKGSWTGEFTGRRRDGSTFLTRGMAAVLRDEAGELIGFYSANIDITEESRLRKELEKSVDDLRCSNRDLEQFAYVASHDLQEPLRMVGSFTQLLAERYAGRLDEKADQYIRFAVEGAQRMQALINDLLAFSRVGTRGKAFERVDVSSVLGDVLAVLGPAIHESSAEVVSGDLPVVQGDPIQIGQLLQNLIGNGIKFRGSSPPRVSVTARPEGAHWLFEVKDNGIGIEQQYFDRVFVIFQRLHTREQYKGSGIGLSIAKRIVERHGGRIWIKSTPGEGSSFFFTLPTRL